MLAMCLVLASCRASEVICTRIHIATFHLTVTDSVTGLGAWYGADLIVTNNEVYDSTAVAWLEPTTYGDTTAVRAFPSLTAERGIFHVRVRKAGYRLWERSAIGVGGDVCHPTSMALDVRLQPEP